MKKEAIQTQAVLTLLEYGLTEVKRAPSQIFDLLLNMPLWA